MKLGGQLVFAAIRVSSAAPSSLGFGLTTKRHFLCDDALTGDAEDLTAVPTKIGIVWIYVMVPHHTGAGAGYHVGGGGSRYSPRRILERPSKDGVAASEDGGART